MVTLLEYRNVFNVMFHIMINKRALLVKV